MKTEKTFPYSESNLLKIAKRFNNELLMHRSAIEGFDPEMNAQFEKQFQEALEISITHPQNKNLDQETIRLHDEIGQLIDEVKQHIIFVKHYLLKAFPHDPSIWEQFGYCEFESIANNYFKLKSCLEQLAKTVKNREMELARFRFPFERVRQIEALSNKIEDKNHEIIAYYEANDRDDNERIKKLNGLYGLMKMIDLAARKYQASHHDELSSLLLP